MGEHRGRRGPLPPVYFLASLLIAIGLHYQAPLVTVVPDPWHWFGLVLVLAGIGIVIQPALAFRNAQTAIRPFKESSSLVTSGMYRVTRNPMYLGMLTVQLGVGALLGTLGALLVPILLFLVLRYRFVQVEEKMLEEKFGDEYRDFKSAVRRWI